MPRFVVKEERTFKVTYLLEAADEMEAKHLTGVVLDEEEDSYSVASQLLSVERVDDDQEEL